MKTIDSWTHIAGDKELLHRCKQAVTEAVPDATVILYGSRARGDARKDSDYDLMVLVNQPVNMTLRDKILDQLFPLELESEQVLTFMVHSHQQWNSSLYRAMPFHENVEKEGVLL